MPVAERPPHTTNNLTPPPSPSPRQRLWRNHPQSPAGNSAVRCVVNCQAKSKPRAVGTRVAVLFVGWPASSETSVANPRLRHVAAVASFRSVGSSSSNPSLCWRPLDTGPQRPHTRSCHRRSRTLHRGSVAVQHSTTLIQLGGCFPSITHKDLTSISGGRFIRSNWIVAFPTSVSPTMRVPLTDQSKCSSH